MIVLQSHTNRKHFIYKQPSMYKAYNYMKKAFVNIGHENVSCKWHALFYFHFPPNALKVANERHFQSV